MKKTFSASAIVTIVLALSANSAFAREIKCKLPGGSTTLGGVTALDYTQDSDWRSLGKLSIRTIGKADVKVKDATIGLVGGTIEMGSIDYREITPIPASSPASTFSVIETLTLQKTHFAEGETPVFALVNTRRTLYGQHCDGYHSCEEVIEVLDRVVIPCTDSADLPKAPSEGYKCDPTVPGDCE